MPPSSFPPTLTLQKYLSRPNAKKLIFLHNVSFVFLNWQSQDCQVSTYFLLRLLTITLKYLGRNFFWNKPRQIFTKRHFYKCKIKSESAGGFLLLQKDKPILYTELLHPVHGNYICQQFSTLLACSWIFSWNRNVQF